MSVSRLTVSTVFAVALAFTVSVAEAQPAISGVTGTPSHGATGTITGTGFDTKPAQTPRRYDDFQSVSVNSPIVTSTAPGPRWQNNCNDLPAENVIPIATAKRIRPNTPWTRNMEAHWNSTGGPSKDVSNISLCSESLSKFTLDAWIYNDTKGASFTCPGGINCNWKHVRLHQATGVNMPNIGFTDTGVTGAAFYGCAGDGRASREPCEGYTNAAAMYNAWFHITWMLDAKGGGTANGSVRIYVNGILAYTSDAFPLLNVGFTDWPRIYIGNYLRNDAEFTGHVYSHWESLYLDSGWNRVEWASTSNCATAPHREIQPYTAWSNTSITTTWNRGSFLPGDRFYVCVWNNSNVPDAKGPFTVGQDVSAVKKG